MKSAYSYKLPRTHVTTQVHEKSTEYRHGKESIRIKQYRTGLVWQNTYTNKNKASLTIKSSNQHNREPEKSTEKSQLLSKQPYLMKMYKQL